MAHTPAPGATVLKAGQTGFVAIGGLEYESGGGLFMRMVVDAGQGLATIQDSYSGMSIVPYKGYAEYDDGSAALGSLAALQALWKTLNV